MAKQKETLKIMNINSIVFLVYYVSTAAIRFSFSIATLNPQSLNFEPSLEPPYFESSTSKQTATPSTPSLTSHSYSSSLEFLFHYQDCTINVVIHRFQVAESHSLPSTSLFIPEDV